MIAELLAAPQTGLKVGDRVIYVGDRFECYWGVDLTLNKSPDNGRTWACQFPEADRPAPEPTKEEPTPTLPAGFGLTTWIDADDLLQSIVSGEVAA
jgi:hypothetical protein